MAQESKKKNLIYCRASFLKKKSNLQAALKRAFENRKLVKERIEVIGQPDDSDGYSRFINSKVIWRQMQFGTLVSFTPGQNRHVLGIVEDEEEVPVAQLAPPIDDAGHRQEFVNSVLHFGVLDNHLILAQAADLRFQTLEAHLNWFLRESGAIGNENGLSLDREITVDVRKRARKNPVKRVTVSQPLVASVERDDKMSISTKRETFRPFGRGVDILKRLMSDEILPKSFDFTKIAGVDEVFVEVSVSYRGRHNAQYDKALRSIVGAAKHIDEDSLQVQFEDGKAHKGKLLVGEPRHIRHVNGLPDPEDMWTKMHEQMKQWLDEKQI
jgi:hypothetical protein